MSSKPLIYLASPYTSCWSGADASVQQKARFDEACRVASLLMKRGHLVFSPIAYSHQFVGSPYQATWDAWAEHDSKLVAAADELWVLKLAGWDSSKGVRAECELARSLGKPLAYITPDDIVPEYEVY